ncbi:MAG: ABC-2 transporter permease [Eubacterium sp.]|nr:ABC-2 transporter permease [Eubacterium sp.]MCI8918248.1 ABC-2 transporter permease [Eubacterium sp.]
MKGLLIKDLKLIKTQKTFLIIVAGICVALLASGKEMSVVFAYVAAVLSMVVVSTVSYDEYNNGMSFLFTFPVSRKKYVLEKYVFGILSVAAVLAAGSGLMGVVSAVKLQSFQQQEWFLALLGAVLTAVLILSLYLPVQLKFGAEKGKIVMFLIIAAVVGLGYAVKEAALVFQVDLSGIMEQVMNAGTAQVTAALAALSALLMVISYMVSVAVMKRKQF